MPLGKSGSPGEKFPHATEGKESEIACIEEGKRNSFIFLTILNIVINVFFPPKTVRYKSSG